MCFLDIGSGLVKGKGKPIQCFDNALGGSTIYFRCLGKWSLFRKDFGTAKQEEHALFNAHFLDGDPFGKGTWSLSTSRQ